MSDPIVEVAEGKLKGKVTESVNGVQYYIFKGIPYAKPPVNELRFAAPLPPDSWEGIRDATKDCNICAQFNQLTNSFLGDEDCLYLNVYTPALQTDDLKLLPVIFFIHGGAFLFGNGTNQLYQGPDYLIEKNVVVVTFNYRLGILGFLSLNHKNAPGNMGLKDQVMALKWVQNNIHKFGGDPTNVTLLGFSAGAASVLYHMLSPMANGLFHKAIAQSGTPICHWAQYKKIKEIASKIPERRGTNISDVDMLLKYLKELPVQELVVQSVEVLSSVEWQGGPTFAFVPTVENDGEWETFLSKSPLKLLSRGEIQTVPLIIGCCEDEGLMMLTYDPINFSKLKKDKDFVCHLPFKLDNNLQATQEKFTKVYLEDNSQHEDKFAVNFFTDAYFLGCAYVTINHVEKLNNPVYFYMFSYNGGFNSSRYMKEMAGYEGVSHGDDTGYVMKKYAENISVNDRLVRDRIVEMWTNFARYGDPTPKTDNVITTKWERTTTSSTAYLKIDDKLTMEYNLYPSRMMLYKELYDKQ